MLNSFRKLISICEIGPRDITKKQEYRSLSELVTILFAVIFGVGLSQLGEFESSYDLGVLVLGYLTVILSWWGYNWGIMMQPETNVLNYIIDVFLIVIYWWLINLRTPMWKVVLGYFIMFGLYWLWEEVRKYSYKMPQTNKIVIYKAVKLNLLFFVLAGLLLVFKSLWSVPISDSLPYLVLLFLLVGIYRYWVYKIYHPRKHEPLFNDLKDSEETLISRACDVAANAKVHLSGFRVGAAIVSDTGNIYSGCNVEFDNYSNTIHAEEAAISAFVAAGEKRALTLAVFTFGNNVSFPCGMCRQSLFELGGKKMKIIACNEHECETKTIEELLPEGFRL
jgi:cytidine deaminase